MEEENKALLRGFIEQEARRLGGLSGDQISGLVGNCCAKVLASSVGIGTESNFLNDVRKSKIRRLVGKLGQKVGVARG